MLEWFHSQYIPNVMSKMQTILSEYLLLVVGSKLTKNDDGLPRAYLSLD